MIDARTTTRSSVVRRPWLIVAAAAAALGLLTAVAIDTPESPPTVPGSPADDDPDDRSEDEDPVPRSPDDGTLELMRKLVEQGQIPSASLD
jgi:hypothetical protein